MYLFDFYIEEVIMYGKIMVPLDGSELAECVLPHLEGFILDCRVNTIVLIRIIEPAPKAYRGKAYSEGGINAEALEENAKRIEEKRKASAEAYLHQVVDRFKNDNVEFKMEVIAGYAADSLVDYSLNNDIDLILIATHGRSGITRWVRGSIADRILRASSVPVLMVRAPGSLGKSVH